MWCYSLIWASLIAGLNANMLFGLDRPTLLDKRLTTSQPFTWVGANYVWPCSTTKNMFIGSGKYKKNRIIATRGVISGNEAILASPRFRSGVPATLVKVELDPEACDAVFQPYPNWNMQEEGNCNAFQSVVDLFLDENKILWVLDSGIVNTLENPLRKCPPKVVAISLKTDKVLRVINLDGLVTSTSRLQYLVADYAPNGRSFIYISDAGERALIIYDVQASRGYRIVLPKEVTDGCKKRDVLYIVLIRKPCGSNELYFTYLGSKRLFSISTEYLRNGNPKGKISDIGIKPKRLVIIGTDNGAALFFRYEGQPEIYRWDTTTPFYSSNFHVVHRSKACQLATHAMADYRCGRMRVLESNFLDYIEGTVGCGVLQNIALMELLP